MIVLIDANNWFHSLWHARRGEQVSAEFSRRVQAVHDHWHPLGIACAFDGVNNFRKGLDPEYKANRKRADEALFAELAELPAMLARGGLANPVTIDGFEADDVLATAAHWAVQNSQKCVLCTGDKDVRQCLVEGMVTICREFRLVNNRIEARWVTYSTHKEEKGVWADQWIDWLSLVGDRTDGVRGADGIGEKTATCWIGITAPAAAIMPRSRTINNVEQSGSIGEGFG